MCVRGCVCVCVCVRVRVRVRVRVFVLSSVPSFVRLSVCLFAPVGVRVSVWACACVDVCQCWSGLMATVILTFASKPSRI